MKKVLYNQLVDQYSAYNLEYAELYNSSAAPEYDENVAFVAGKCYVLHKILYILNTNSSYTLSLLNYLKIDKDICERDYNKAMNRYNAEKPEYVYCNHPTYYKGCIEIYTDVIKKLSKELNKDVCL